MKVFDSTTVHNSNSTHGYIARDDKPNEWPESGAKKKKKRKNDPTKSTFEMIYAFTRK